jgi:glycosyltransferase involved in cell wall biosynthesis
MFNYEYPPVGGGGGVVHEVIAEQLARRHRVVVVTSGYDDLPRREVRGGVEIVRVPVLGRSEAAVASIVSMLSYPPAAWLAAARLLRRERFDVVNAHFAVPTGVGSVPPARLARIPHVTSLHGGDIYDPSKRFAPHRVALLRAAVSAVLRASAAVVAQSTNTRENAYRYYSFRGPITIIPHGIRTSDAPLASRAELGLPADAFVGVTVGRLVPRKGLDRLLAALATPACVAVHLVVVGEGPELEPLRARAAELGLAERVRFTGRVEEERKWQLLRAADAYLSATLHEGFGLVYLEAMSAGLPVVTPDHGGQSDFLEDGITGWLVAPGDVGALSGAIARLVGSPERREAMRRENRARAERFTPERCAEAYEQLFASVARPSGAAVPSPHVSDVTAVS